MAVRLSALRAGRTLLPTNFIIKITFIDFELLNNNDLECVYSLTNMDKEDDS
jgi:hypothetical protein